LPSGGQFLADEEREITAARKAGQGHFVADERNPEGNRWQSPRRTLARDDASASMHSLATVGPSISAL
jgi:hypothetical protein